MADKSEDEVRLATLSKRMLATPPKPKPTKAETDKKAKPAKRA